MRRIAYLLTATTLVAGFASSACAQDADRSVKDGGIKVAGWKGRVDRKAAAGGKTVNDSKVTSEGGSIRMSVGPAGNFWNPANVASGNYHVDATFKEHKMAASHPHSYGVFIGGKDLESDNETLMYCIAYGNGTYSVKTFHGAKVTTLVDRAASPALKKAGENGESTNKIGWHVEGGKASCLINDTVAKTFEQADAIGPDKLTSFDGTYGVRVSHNLELTVSPFLFRKL